MCKRAKQCYIWKDAKVIELIALIEVDGAINCLTQYKALQPIGFTRR